MSDTTVNLSKIKNILRMPDAKLDSYLIFCEENIINKILEFCNLEKLPEKLNIVVQEFLMEQYELNKNGVLQGKQEVSSVSDNGQSVSFNTVGGLTSISKNADDFIKRNMQTLITYRKLKK